MRKKSALCIIYARSENLSRDPKGGFSHHGCIVRDEVQRTRHEGVWSPAGCYSRCTRSSHQAVLGLDHWNPTLVLGLTPSVPSYPPRSCMPNLRLLPTPAASLHTIYAGRRDPKAWVYCPPSCQGVMRDRPRMRDHFSLTNFLPYAREPGRQLTVDI
jgi:hypothetical protein